MFIHLLNPLHKLKHTCWENAAVIMNNVRLSRSFPILVWSRLTSLHSVRRLFMLAKDKNNSEGRS